MMDVLAEVDGPLFWGAAESKRVFIPTGQKTKTGKDKKFPVTFRRIHVVCKRSGNEMFYPRMVRGGVESFGDSEMKKPDYGLFPFRRNRQQLFEHLARFLGAQDAATLVGAV